MATRSSVYITHTDFSKLVLYSRFKHLKIITKKPEAMDTELAHQLLNDIDVGTPTDGYEADFNRIQRIATCLK